MYDKILKNYTILYLFSSNSFCSPFILCFLIAKSRFVGKCERRSFERNEFTFKLYISTKRVGNNLGIFCLRCFFEQIFRKLEKFSTTGVSYLLIVSTRILITFF